MGVVDYDRVLRYGLAALRRGIESYVGSFSQAADQSAEAQSEALIAINRAVELITKWWLCQSDPGLVVKCDSTEDRLKLSGLIKDPNFFETRKTITGLEALDLVEKAKPGLRLGALRGLNSLRNVLEHFPMYGERHFQQKVDSIPGPVLEELEALVASLTGKSLNHWIDPELIESCRSCASPDENEQKFQADVLNHSKAWKAAGRDKERFRPYPIEYEAGHQDFELDAECPVCKDQLVARYKEKADYDEEGPVGVYGDVRCVYCKGCHFVTTDFHGIAKYVPDGVLSDQDLYAPDESDLYDEDMWRDEA